MIAIPASFARLSIWSLSRRRVRPASTASAVVFVSIMVSMVVRPMTGTSKSKVCASMRRFDEPEWFAIRQRSGTPKHGVRAFHGFCGYAGLFADGNALTDIGGREDRGHAAAVLNVCFFFLCGFSTREDTRGS